MRLYKTWVIANLLLVAVMVLVFPVVLVLYGGYWEAVGSMMAGLWCLGVLIGAVHEIRHK